MLVHVCLFLCIGYRLACGESLLPKEPECGQQIVDSGVELRHVAKEGEFPWTVALKYRDEPPYKCVGSLINDRYVLTSSVCVSVRNQEVISVLLGGHTLDQSAHSKEYEIEKVIPHKNFKKGGKEFDNDIALIKLNSTVKFSDYIKPICLPTNETSAIKPDEKVIIAGWGKNVEGQTVTTKKVIIRRVITNEVCAKEFEKHRFTVGENFLCTDGLMDYKDYICAGDGGAPVIIKREAAWYQEGIVSFGSQCGHDFPDANTRVSKYLSWINENMDYI